MCFGLQCKRILTICLCDLCCKQCIIQCHRDQGQPQPIFFFMQTEQDMYRSSISVQFLCEEEETPAEKALKPNSASEVLADFSLVRTYSTDSVYIEEYDGVRSYNRFCQNH